MTTAPAAVEAIAPFDVTALENLGIPALPAEREALRHHLLDAIARIRPILEADAEDNDAGETLGLAFRGRTVPGGSAVAESSPRTRRP